MKLRVRIKKPIKKTVIIELDSVSNHRPVLGDLVETAAQALGLHRENVVLSLNGSDPLEGEDVLLSELGIVNGDLLIAMVKGNCNLETDEPCQAHGKNDIPHGHQDTHHQNEVSISQEDQHAIGTVPENQQTKPEVTKPEEMDTNASSNSACNMDSVEELDESQLNRYLQEAILIRDSNCDGSNIPNSLLGLIRDVGAQSMHDAVFVVLHVLMQETGFTLDGEDNHLLPSTWCSGSLYKLIYTYPGIQTMEFTLMGVPMAGTLIVHGIVNIEAEVTKHQMRVKSADYVSNIPEGPVLKNLPKLSREFKDKVSYALLQCATKDTVLAVPSLSSLFHELKLMILQHLDAASLLRLSQTCSDYKELCRTPSIWYRLFIKEFGKHRAINDHTNQDWLRLYKDQYIMRQQRREQMKRIRMVVPPFADSPFPPFPGPRPWVPPFGIGGDYDRDPGIPHPLHPGRGGMFSPMRPRFDPIGPIPGQLFRPGRGGGMRDDHRFGRPSRSMFGGGRPMF